LKALEELADPDIFRAVILEVAAEPVSEEPKTWSRICERRAMDPGRLRSIWNQLGNYLHVRQPEDRHTLMKAYPDACSLKKSLLELLEELAPLASGSDIHFVKERTYFHCSCGFRVERSSATLRDSQLVTCINPKCRKEWVVQERQGQYRFESNVIDVPCRRCDHQQPLAQRDVREMRPGQRYRFTCDACGAAHWVRCSFDYALADEASTA
jgi:hypothetical protein